MNLKCCRRCSISKSTSEFNKHKGRPDGYLEICRVCRIASRDHAKEAAARMIAYYANHSVNLQQQREWQKKNRETLRRSCRQWRANNPEAQAAAGRSWYERNPQKRRLYTSNRNAAKKQRTPSWLSDEQRRQIADFYYLADALTVVAPERYEVDHIVPLQGENVSGLHVPWNLQLLTEHENCVKGNRYEPQ